MINRKKYKKIVVSCIVMSFMVFALLFYVKDTEATDNEIVYAPNYVYTTSKYVVNEEKIAPDAPSEISGYLFAGWYTLPEGSTTYTPVAEPKENETYYAKFVPQEILGMKAQVTTALIKDEATSKTANSAIRFITTVDSDLYKEVGFNIDRPGKSAPYDTGNGVVYKELYAVDATRENKGEPDTTYTPDMFHKQSEYFKTWTIGKIPETYYDSDITVRPYWITLDGTRVDGETAVKTVNYGRAWYYVDAEAEATNIAAPKGTASNPYKTLADAVAVETTLNPKLILKSDVTVDATVNITRTMTVESFNEAKTITYSDTTKNMMEVAENGNLTLNKLNLNGGNNVVNSTNATVTANYVNIQEGGVYGFRMVGGTANLNNVEITGVDRGVRLESSAIVTGDTLNIISPQQGVSCGGGSTFDYKNLTINGNTNNAINVFGNSTVIVNGGGITNAKGNGLNVGGAKAATLTGVDITFAADATGGYGINAYSEENVVPNVTLVDVDVTGAPEDGVLLRDGVTGSYTRGTVSGSKGKGIYLYDSEAGTNGAFITMEDVNIENSTGENLYLNHSSSVTINGTLTTTGGFTYSLAIYNGSTLAKGDNYSKIEINSPGNIGIRLYNKDSQLNVGDMILTNCKNHGVYIADQAQAVFDKDMNIQGASSGNYDCLYVTGASSQATINGTVTTTGGRYGLGIFSGGKVIKGENYSKITINSSRSHGAVVMNNSEFKAGDITLTGCAGDGIHMRYDTPTVTLIGLVNMSSITGNGIDIYAGNLAAETVTINVTTANYGLRARGGVTSIGELNISGAKAHSAVRAQDTASLTINGGTIQNSEQYGVNALNTATLTMVNVKILNSGKDDILREHDTATINLTDVEYSTGYGK